MANENQAPEPAVEKNENEIALRETEGLSQGQIILRRFVRHKAAMISIVALVLIILFSYSASGIHLGTKDTPVSIPGWWHFSITDIDPAGAIASSCNNGVTGCPTLDLIPAFIDGTGFNIGAHPLGTDIIGTDYLALVTRGAEQSIMVMLIVGLLGMAIGTTVGAIAGYYGGWVDAVLMRVTDVFLVTPTIVIGAVIGKKFGNLGVVPLALMLGFFAWMGLARFVRTEFLTLRERELPARRHEVHREINELRAERHRRIAGLGGHGKAQVRHRVLVRAIHGRVVRQLGEFLQRRRHLLCGAFEQTTASARE